jgi:hypothetical protein
VISQQLQQHGGRLEITLPKTPYSARVIALDHTTVAVLREHLCVPKTSSTSCDQAIFVDQATNACLFSDAVLAGVDWLG